LDSVLSVFARNGTGHGVRNIGVTANPWRRDLELFEAVLQQPNHARCRAGYRANLPADQRTQRIPVELPAIAPTHDPVVIVA